MLVGYVLFFSLLTVASCLLQEVPAGNTCDGECRDDNNDVICGEDDNEYRNLCHLRQVNCKRSEAGREPVGNWRRGPCSEVKSRNIRSAKKDGKKRKIKKNETKGKKKNPKTKNGKKNNKEKKKDKEKKKNKDKKNNKEEKNNENNETEANEDMETKKENDKNEETKEEENAGDGTK